MDIDENGIYERIGDLIVNTGKPQYEIAETIGIRPSTISRYMSKKQLPDLRYMIALAKYFGVSLDWLAGLDSDRHEIYTDEERKLVTLYSVASEDDRAVIQAVLKKYQRPAKS